MKEWWYFYQLRKVLGTLLTDMIKQHGKASELLIFFTSVAISSFLKIIAKVSDILQFVFVSFEKFLSSW